MIMMGRTALYRKLLRKYFAVMKIQSQRERERERERELTLHIYNNTPRRAVKDLLIVTANE